LENKKRHLPKKICSIKFFLVILRCLHNVQAAQTLFKIKDIKLKRPTEKKNTHAVN